MDDFAARPIQLIAGRTWKGSLFGGVPPINQLSNTIFGCVWFISKCASLPGFKSKDGVPKLVNEYLEKKLKLDEFVTHNMTLAQVNDAIQLMKTGDW